MAGMIDQIAVATMWHYIQRKIVVDPGTFEIDHAGIAKLRKAD